MRKYLLSMLPALALCALMLSPAALAQDATPVGAFESLGLPTLDVSVSMAGYEGIPATIEAGRYLVNLTAAEDQEEGGTVAFIRPPEGKTADDLLAAIAADQGSTAEATPMAEMEASPTADESSLILQVTFAGGVNAAPGQTAQGILDLGPGEWIAWGDGPGSPVPPLVFDVTGELPTDLPVPESNATLTLAEYSITVTEGALTAGPNVIRVDNVGAQPHFVGWFSVPEGTTVDQIQTALDEELDRQRDRDAGGLFRVQSGSGRHPGRLHQHAVAGHLDLGHGRRAGRHERPRVLL